MDYEKAYKAVLKTATQWIKDGCTDKERICLESVFPELRESEDERIRKIIRLALIASEDELSDFYKVHNTCRKECTDWLEKQKEQGQPQVADASKMEPEVDLEEEILNQWEDYPHDKWPKCPYHDFTNIARHFYELGLNARKEEKK